jgi:hypothetical protein
MANKNKHIVAELRAASDSILRAVQYEPPIEVATILLAAGRRIDEAQKRLIRLVTEDKHYGQERSTAVRESDGGKPEGVQ